MPVIQKANNWPVVVMPVKPPKPLTATGVAVVNWHWAGP